MSDAGSSIEIVLPVLCCLEDSKDACMESIITATFWMMPAVVQTFCRWFIPEEVGMIEADVEQLGALFNADGEGLPDDVIATVMAPIEELLTVLQLDTSILIGNFKQASSS